MIATVLQPSAAKSFESIVVFGDSLSDNGNAGRFSNGPVWVEQLARGLGLPLAPSSQGGTNYAVGAARAEDVFQQIEQFLATRPTDLGHALVVVYAGGNDVRALDREDPTIVLRRAVRLLGRGIAELADAGATRFLVPNLPDIGLSAEAIRAGDATAAAMTAVSIAFNHELALEIDRLSHAYPITIRTVDVFALHRSVVADPAAHGFTNVRDPCLGRCAEPDRWLLWDPIHPTTAAHARLAEASSRALLEKH
ncbi:MAG TPA: SGNH/GDSL hydrolase family protein [Prosthecobacter sp.]|nr:SGNH/GDSL hydrolase family protein [Prosthecobacter sp.]